MHLLIIGGGGREHAIAKKLAESKHVKKVFVAPGNDGMATEKIAPVPIGELEIERLIEFANVQDIDYTVVGPEAPLLAGLVDAFEKAGLKVFGPRRKAALIEGSKDFAKQLMNKYHIPTARSATFTDFHQALHYVKTHGVPIVIKADGLAAGKGVTVAFEESEAILALKEMMLEGKFGQSSSKVVIEDYLEGEEFSLMAFVNGEEVYPMAVAQDHKRAYDGDKGPNTGGMGAYSPVPYISDDVIKQAIEGILKPTANGLKQEGIYYRGILYAGLILTNAGPKVIEFNARFGDPEAQVVLPRLKSDLACLIADLLADIPPQVRFKNEGVNIGVVLASAGYPNDYEKGHILTGLDNLSSEVTIYHACTKKEAGHFVSNGGRVALISIEGEDMKSARTKLYKEMKKLDNPNFFYRIDIGAKAE